MKKQTEDIAYEGNAFLRLISYMKPYRGMFALCLVLVLGGTAMEILRPVIIGNAIDRYITGE